MVPKATRSAQEVGEVKDEILECAMDIMFHEGYDNLTMGKIGARMNMTAANLYNYFGNKEEIFFSVHKKSFDLLYKELCASLEPETDELARVKKFIEAYVEFGIRNSHYYHIMFGVPTPKYVDYIGAFGEEDARNARLDSLKLLDLAIKTLSGYLSTLPGADKEDARILTMSIWCSLHGLVSLYNNRMLRGADDNPELLVKQIVETMLNRWLRHRKV
jgi:AcrR family transcriptional regulator